MLLKQIWIYSLLALFGAVAYLHGPNLLAKLGIFSKWLSTPILFLATIALVVIFTMVIDGLIDKLKKF